jgi:hypothetical protein
MGAVTSGQVQAALQAVAALAEAVRGLGEVPSGVLYAHVMGSLSLAQYEQALALLKRAGLVEQTPGHVLRWVGPALEATG